MTAQTTTNGLQLCIIEPQAVAKRDERYAVELVWQYYQQWHPQARLDEKRDRLIRNRLRDGYSVQQLQEAVAGCHADPWYRGENDRGQPYCDIALILRDADHVDRFRELHWHPRTPTRLTGRDVTRMAGGSDQTESRAASLVANAAAGR